MKLAINIELDLDCFNGTPQRRNIELAQLLKKAARMLERGFDTEEVGHFFVNGSFCGTMMFDKPRKSGARPLDQRLIE